MEKLNSAVPPEWSLWCGDGGRVAILLALALFVLSALAWLLAPKAQWLIRAGVMALNAGVGFLFVSFVCLGGLFVGNRFEYDYVFQHGDKSSALPYQIAGIWSGQQGSFLLWACASGLFALLTAKGTGNLRRWYSIVYASFLAGLAGILAFESPFQLNQVDGKTVYPTNGAGLAPSLQNYWVTIHPPTIFLGFGALTVLFAYAIAAMVEKDFSAWIPKVRPWALVSLAILGLGLCMGGFWAYETLGWGGFWMWDPAEDVSFVPWCLSVVFVHGIIVQAARGNRKSSNLLFGGLPFLTFLYGTFLTRSGFLANASVHSFAEMNRSALQLLMGLMGVSLIAFFGLWFVRAIQLKRITVAEGAQKTEESPYRREALINLGMASVLAIGLATMFGMSVPFVQAIQKQPSKVVEEGLYHQVLAWFFIPTMILMAVAPFASWRSATWEALAKKAYSILCISVGFTGLFMIALVFTPFGKVIERSPLVTLLGHHDLPGMAWLLFLVGLCAFAIIGNLWRIYELKGQSRVGWSPFLAHIGVALLMFGLIVSRGFEQKGEAMVMKDHPGKALGYEFRYRSMTSNDLDRNNHVLFDAYGPDDSKNPLFTVTPGMYKVVGEGGSSNVMVWPSIVHRPLYDVYFALRPPHTQITEPMPIKVGASAVVGGLVVKYDKMTMVGQPGQPGTAFVANLTITAGHTTRKVSPSMEIGEAGPVHHNAVLDDDFNVQIASMNAADRSVNLQFEMSSPIYPVEVFHKPMTLFVWLGTGFMTFAGLLAAAYRRAPSPAKAKVEPLVPVTPKKPAPRKSKLLGENI